MAAGAIEGGEALDIVNFEDLRPEHLGHVASEATRDELTALLEGQDLTDHPSLDPRVSELVKQIFPAAKEAVGWLFIDEVPSFHGFDLTNPAEQQEFMKAVTYGVLLGTAGFMKEGFDFSDDEDIPHDPPTTEGEER